MYNSKEMLQINYLVINEWCYSIKLLVALLQKILHLLRKEVRKRFKRATHTTLDINWNSYSESLTLYKEVEIAKLICFRDFCSLVEKTIAVSCTLIHNAQGFIKRANASGEITAAAFWFLCGIR